MMKRRQGPQTVTFQVQRDDEREKRVGDAWATKGAASKRGQTLPAGESSVSGQ